MANNRVNGIYLSINNTYCNNILTIFQYINNKKREFAIFANSLCHNLIYNNS